MSSMVHHFAPECTETGHRNWKFEIGEGKSSRGLGETVVSLAEEGEEAEVAEDLELLADFVADVSVVGMEFGQSFGVSIYIGESEFEFAQGLHHLKDVEGPATLFNL